MKWYNSIDVDYVLSTSTATVDGDISKVTVIEFSTKLRSIKVQLPSATSARVNRQLPIDALCNINITAEASHTHIRGVLLDTQTAHTTQNRGHCRCVQHLHEVIIQGDRYKCSISCPRDALELLSVVDSCRVWQDSVRFSSLTCVTPN